MSPADCLFASHSIGIDRLAGLLGCRLFYRKGTSMKKLPVTQRLPARDEAVSIAAPDKTIMAGESGLASIEDKMPRPSRRSITTGFTLRASKWYERPT